MPTANEVWRDFNTDGVPGSGVKEPEKAQIRTWGTAIEQSVDSLYVRQVADLTAFAASAFATALVTRVTVSGRDNASYKRLGSAPAPVKAWHLQDSLGNWWQLDSMLPTPRMFGATGDGTTDDYVAFTACEEYAGIFGATVYVPPGTYALGTALNIARSNATWMGYAPSTTVIKRRAGATLTHVVLIGNAAGSTAVSQALFAGITVDGNGSASTAALRLRNAESCLLSDLILKGATGRGFREEWSTAAIKSKLKRSEYRNIVSTGNTVADLFSLVKRVEEWDDRDGYAAYLELLRLVPGIQAFEDTGATVKMTEWYLREMISEMARSGVTDVIVPYLEYFGYWFYQPSHAYWFDYDSNSAGDYWWIKAGSLANVDQFNPLDAILDVCDQLGIRVWLGLGRHGDTPLLNDLYAVNVLSAADPNRWGLSLSARITQACNRARQVAADFIAQFGDRKSFFGFYVSHETDHVGSSNNYYTPMLFTSGADPAVRSYGKLILNGPSSPIDHAATQAFGNTLAAAGIDIWSPQDSVGPGYRFSDGKNTFVPAVTIADVGQHFADWRIAIDLGNNVMTPKNRLMRLWGAVELFRMGVVPSVGCTLSNTTGIITATKSSGAFVAGDVGKLINGAASVTSGRGQITAVNAGVATVTVQEAFGGTTLAADLWAITSATFDGYADDYPADWASVKATMKAVRPYVEKIVFYAWFGLVDSGSLSLRTTQSYHSFTDYRTRAISAFDGLKGDIVPDTAERFSRVTAQFSATSNVTLAAVPGLQVFLRRARTYRFRAVIFTSANASGGIKMDVSGTATATAISVDAMAFINAASPAKGRATALGVSIVAQTAMTDAMVIIEGLITVNGGGTFGVRFAQNASNAAASSVLVNSYLHVQEVL